MMYRCILLLLIAVSLLYADDFSGYVPGFHVEHVSKPADCTYRAQEGDFMYQDYTGTLEDGTVFDSSYDRGQTFNFHLGLGEVIKGIDMGMKGMCKGEKRVITIPPQLGYGDQERGKIPANSVLIFEVVLTDLELSGFKIQLISLPDDCVRRSAAGDYIREHYNGTFTDGTVFDRSYDRGQTYDFTLGEGNVIKGVDMGLMNMCVGERRRLTLPPILAYGERGYTDLIPPGSTLVFEVELVEIVKGTIRWYKIDGPSCLESERVIAGDKITISYNGFTQEGYQFSSSNKESVTVEVGGDNVLHGLTHGVHGMCIGERRRIRVPHEFSHGDIDNDDIPQGVRLTLDVELLDIPEKQDMFKQIDENKDRYVSEDEVKIWISKNPDFDEERESEGGTERLFKLYFTDRDTDDNGWMSRNEFYDLKPPTHDEL